MPELTDFAYSTLTNGMTVLSKIRNSLAADWVTYGNSDSDYDKTIIGYDTNSGKVTSVTEPTPSGTSSTTSRQPSHSYTYVSSSEARVNVAGISPTQGYYGDFVWDAGGRTTQSTDSTGATVQNVWDNATDNLISTVHDARQINAGTQALQNLALETSHVYDQFHRSTDVFGPAPARCFTTPTAPTPPASPTSPTPNGTCTSPSVAHTSTIYDGINTVANTNDPYASLSGGNNGLAATYWTTTTLTGPTMYHSFVNGNSGGDVSTGAWSNEPSQLNGAANWSTRLTGQITLGTSGTYYFNGSLSISERVYIDDKLVFDSWPGEAASSYVPFNNTNTGLYAHRIRIDAQFPSASGNGGVTYRLPGSGSDVNIPGGALIPRYDLVTSTTTDDGTTNSHPTVNSIGYGANPAYGLPSSTSVDPGSQNLTSNTAFETFGTGYLRPIVKGLPSGSSTGDYYYATPGTSYSAGVNNAYSEPESGLTNPCTGAAAGEQGGLLAESDAPAPATNYVVAMDYVYDNNGRVVASWNRGDTSYSCTTYDARGRVATKTAPTYNGVAGYTLTYNYAVSGNPLVTSVSDSSAGSGSSPITTTTDLLGQVTTYVDAWGRTTSYLYDQAGRSIESDATSDSRSTTFDSSGRVSAQNMGANNTQLYPVASVPTTGYDAASNLTHVDYPTGTNMNGNGTSTDLTYDPYGHANGLTYKSGTTTLGTDAETFSQQGRVMTDTIGGIANASSYTYDTVGRLTNASVNGNTYAYGYAASGGCGISTAAGKNSDRTSFSYNGGTAATYCYDNADRLTSTTATGYTGTVAYDTHGNTTTMSGNTMTYDGDNQHLSTTAGSTTVTYKRDALGRIIERDTSTPGGITYKGQTSANNGAGSDVFGT